MLLYRYMKIRTIVIIFIMEVRKSTSDKEFENWVYKSVPEKKGFVREIAAGNIGGTGSE
ncbi:MAG: hypothetical protein ACRD5J_13435 [Nitrososphaeraceae archaeon]